MNRPLTRPPRRRWRALNALLLAAFLLQSVGAGALAYQGDTPEARAAALLAGLTPEERVGQLFLVSFEGTDTGRESQIYDLIVNQHIGGVVLEAENNNFSGGSATALDTWSLIQSLQRLESNASNSSQTDPTTGEPYTPTYIPLLIGISQEGGGPAGDNLHAGLTPLPNQLAIGASWNPALAQQVGEVLGRELRALGFNLIFGPSLDVLEDPSPERTGDLGVRSFGGDPYWVGLLGQAMVAGLHSGSDNRLIVVGKHFPGHGGSDRPPEEEVPTIRKSLEQLTQIELAPFFAVTGQAPSAAERVDGLLLSHIRYQGFQGNIRATTRPLSFDPQAFEQVMALPDLARWRTNGGLIVSDELGSRAVRRFYDPTEATFTGRLVARDAFLAGNDLLYLGDFQGHDSPNTYTSILRSLTFFAQKYREDVAFAQRVDAAVLRILTAKFRLYDTFRLDQVLTSVTGLQVIGQSQAVTFEVARQAATLLSPDAVELDATLPTPPEPLQRIVILTDSVPHQQCADCAATLQPGVGDFAEVALRLYGPQAGGQIQSQNLFSFSYSDLLALLNGDPAGDRLLSELRIAQWLVVAAQDVRADRPESQALRRLLSERPDLLSGKRVVVFAFNAPYYLDATDISKLTAYYGLYSAQPQFLEVAARLLFRELPTAGASPVSVDGVGYNLLRATLPNPGQTLQLTIAINGEQVFPLPGEAATAEPAALAAEVGDSLTLQTGIILDRNGHRVPDNTPVTFTLTTTTESASLARELTATTRGGVAQTAFIADTGGLLEVRASSGEPAALSASIPIEVAGNGTVVPNQTQPVAESTAAAENGGDPAAPAGPRQQTNFGDWVLLTLVTGFVSLFAYQGGALAGQVRWGVRWALLAFIGGTLVNVYLALGAPGTLALLRTGDAWGVALAGGLGAALGWAAGVGWRALTRRVT